MSRPAWCKVPVMMTGIINAFSRLGSSFLDATSLRRMIRRFRRWTQIFRPAQGKSKETCRILVILFVCVAAAPCLAQIGVTYDSLGWKTDGSTGAYNDPNNWQVLDDPQVPRTGADTAPRPTDVINIRYGTIVFSSSATNAELATFPPAGGTARFQLNGATLTL